MSTPKFIMALTEISLALINVLDRKAYLKTELSKLNRALPGTVYIPFVNNSMRNYAVLHIAIEEAKVFQTKERAPLLLCIEVFRPEELTLIRDAKKARNGATQKNNYLRSPLEENPNLGDDLAADVGGAGGDANYRSYSWHSSMHNNSRLRPSEEVKQPLLPPENPYAQKQQQPQSRKQTTKSKHDLNSGSQA